MALDVELERDVLAVALRDIAFLRVAVPVLREHSFSSPQHAWVWRQLSEGFERGRELVTPRLLGIALARDYEKEEEQEHVAGILRALATRRVGAPRLALEEVRRFARFSAVRRALGDAVEGLDDGDVEAAEAALSSGLLDARAASALSEPSRGDEWEARLRSYLGEDAPRVRFEMPLPSLTRFTGGGLPPGAVALAVAQTNVGKSTWVVDVGFTALLRDPRCHVAHVTTEETEREAFGRYDARVTGIERQRLLSGRLDPSEVDLFKARLSRAAGLTSRLHVAEMAPGSPAPGLWGFVERVREAAGDGPVLLIVDSPDHLKPNVKREESHRLSTAAVYWSLKALAKDTHLGPAAVWAVTWAPAEYEKKKATANATSETKEKGRIADFMVHLSDGEGASSEEEEQEVMFDVVKNRLGKVKAARVAAKANLGTCEFTEMEVAS